MKTLSTVKGSSFLVSDINPEEIFTPEDLTVDQLAIMKTAQDFVRKEVKPVLDRLVRLDLPLTRELLLKAGALGLLGADIDKEYGGMGLDKIASTLIAAASAEADVFALTWSAHSGIGTMPLAIFGSRAQKEKYLPDLVRGSTVGAYALTEPLAGSDALSIKTSAVMSPDGRHYILNGDKLFITNGGMADLFTTYAKIDGDKFTAFMIERGFAGVSTGSEINKMGIHGSSTTSLRLKDAMVPVENVLYEIGRGYEVAFCVLDLGRFRLAVACIEKGKLAIEQCVKYANRRIQFGKPISRFGLIQHKIADMSIKTYVSESTIYRTASLLEQACAAVDKNAPDYAKDMYQHISEFTVEYSMDKVLGSETLSDIVDEAVQIFGGRGYLEGNPVERMYRDSRINRIFEGTNEINRLLMVRWLLRKAAAGEIPLFSLARELAEALPRMASASLSSDDGLLGYQKKLLDMAKNIFVLVCAAAARRFEKRIEDEQEILGCLSNMMGCIWAMESGLLRAMKSAGAVGEEKSTLKIDMARVYINDAMALIENNGRQIVAAMETGEALATQLALIRKLTNIIPVNTVAARRRIASAIIEAEKYVC